MPKVMEKLSKTTKVVSEEVRANKTVTPPRLKDASSSKFGVAVAGLDSMMINLAQCCYPVRNDEIKGYITKGQGVTVHRENCHNISDVKERLIDCVWTDVDETHRYETVVMTEAINKNNLVADIITVISQNKANLIEINSKLMSDQINVATTAVIKVKDKEHVNNILVNLQKVEGIYSAKRKGERKQGVK